MSTVMTHAPKGLEGIVATTSKICYIDGDQGVLAYRGIDIHELADNSTFEETCYLLWNGFLPSRSELKELQQRLAAERKLDPAIIEFLRGVLVGATSGTSPRVQEILVGPSAAPFTAAAMRRVARLHDEGYLQDGRLRVPEMIRLILPSVQ